MITFGNPGSRIGTARTSRTSREYPEKDGRNWLLFLPRVFKGFYQLFRADVSHGETHWKVQFLVHELPKGFTMKMQFEAHKAKHDGRMFPCEYCAKRFQSPVSLRRRIKAAHQIENGKIHCM